jgi:hypothetical protein
VRSVSSDACITAGQREKGHAFPGREHLGPNEKSQSRIDDTAVPFDVNEFDERSGCDICRAQSLSVALARSNRHYLVLVPFTSRFPCGDCRLLCISLLSPSTPAHPQVSVDRLFWSATAQHVF